jgi:transcriptional regulator with PAS, ATPase and Fis domain
MNDDRILISWIGNTDLWAMAAEQGEEIQRLVHQATKTKPKLEAGDCGPIRTLVQQRSFKRIDLISNYGPAISNLFKEWLGRESFIHEVELKDPINYEAVFAAARQVFDGVGEVNKASRSQLCVHLSPGTPTMTAVSVLLGKSMYPATFFQTYKGEVTETHIPFDLKIEWLPDVLRERDRLWQELVARGPGEVEGFKDIVGDSREIRLAVGRAVRVAIRNVDVLLTGESGTGKELFAQAIHRASGKPKHLFFSQNCAAIQENRFETEMFGVKKGTYTDVEERPGAFEEANGGTLFLDEIGELSLENQSKLLRAIQPKSKDPPGRRWILRVGEKSEKPFDVRIIAATNRNLLERVAKQQFREDLYYRVAGITVELPPLRQRGGDVRLLADALLLKINQDFKEGDPGYEEKKLSGSAHRRLEEHHWPGNVRELKSVLVHAAVMATESTLTKGDIADAITELPSSGVRKPLLSRERYDGFKLDEHLDHLEKMFVEYALEDAQGVQAEAARLLGLNSQQALKKKMDRLGITAGHGRKG